MTKNVILLVFAALISLAVKAQTGTIQGKVVSDKNTPVNNVNITLLNTNKGTTTDENGNFTLSNVSAGNYTLHVSFVGFKEVNKTISVTNGLLSVPTITLVEGNEELNEIVLEGHHNKYVKREASSSLRLQGELIDLPQNVQIISSELLADQQATSIMDGVIRNVSGVTMLEHWGHFARINMRGFRLPAFRNGFNFLDTWGPLAEDMSIVESVEFVKGPSGFMMAAGEPGGFYNVVTKKPTANRVVNITLSGGSFDFLRGAVDLGGKLTENGSILYRFNGMYQTSDSHRGDENVDRYGFAPALTFNLSDKTSITTELNYDKAESLIGAAYVFAPVADGYGSLDRDFKFTDTNYPATDIEQVVFYTDFKHRFNENWDVQAKFNYLRYDQTGNSTWIWSFDSATGDAIRYVSEWDALSLGKYFQAYVNGKFNTGGISHKVMGGFDFTEKQYWADWADLAIVDTERPFNIYNPHYGIDVTYNFDRSQSVQDRNGGTPYNGNTVRSLYAQDEIGFLENKIRLTLAGRYTNLSTLGKPDNDKVFTPRVGLSVDILPTFVAYALYDQSFLPQAGRTLSGELVNPVDAVDIEGGLKKSFFSGRLKAALGAYQITKENIAFSDPADPTGNSVIELGEVQSKGIEFDLQGEVTPELNVVLNYANTNVEITKDQDPTLVGNRVSGHAKHVTNGWFNYSFAESSKLNGFGASLGYQYQVDRSTWAWAADNQSDLPDYFRLDGALSWKNDKVRVQLNVNNILDEYLYAGANYGSYLYWQSEPGINGRLTVTYNF